GFFVDDRATQFLLIAVAFLLFSIPCFVFVPERGNPRPRPIAGLSVIRESTVETIQTLRDGRQYPGLLRFLVGRVFYTDAINTVIAYMSLYTVTVAIATGLSKAQGEAGAQLILLCAISCAVVGGFAWGAIVDRAGPKRTLDYVLYLWMATFGLAVAVGLFA